MAISIITAEQKLCVESTSMVEEGRLPAGELLTQPGFWCKAIRQQSLRTGCVCGPGCSQSTLRTQWNRGKRGAGTDNIRAQMMCLTISLLQTF